ncbi:MAG: hypothetical protein LBT40_15710 [Deltaproteobacteria bacterium]|jgi:hypothetical protein|nr:hypothetical protein [Deltaproteobacteria bacterium]
MKEIQINLIYIKLWTSLENSIRTCQHAQLVNQEIIDVIQGALPLKQPLPGVPPRGRARLPTDPEPCGDSRPETFTGGPSRLKRRASSSETKKLREFEKYFLAEMKNCPFFGLQERGKMPKVDIVIAYSLIRHKLSTLSNKHSNFCLAASPCKSRPVDYNP